MSLSKMRCVGIALLLAASFALAVPTTAAHASWLGRPSPGHGRAAQHEGFFGWLLRLLAPAGVTIDPNGGGQH